MVLYIAGDIGGTNSRLQLIRAVRHEHAKDQEAGEGEVIVGEQIYPSKGYSTLEEVIHRFLKQYNPSNEPVHCMCLAVAGPVSQNVAKITNLSWLISGPVLKETFRMKEVRILNDFEGIGYGLLALDSNDLELVHAPAVKSNPPPNAVKAVIGAGTGLGECFLTFNGTNYDVWPAEGGHADFAPRNKQEFEIMEYIKKQEKISRVSIERVTSGLGLPRIFEYLSLKNPGKVHPEVKQLLDSKKEDVGKVIGDYAKNGKCPICVETMDIFVSTYGAESGNLCLKTLPYGGLYIAGGIAGKSMSIMRKDNNFVKNFLAKGRLQAELDKIPIYLITHPQVGMLGSKVICRRVINGEPTRDERLSSTNESLKSKL